MGRVNTLVTFGLSLVAVFGGTDAAGFGPGQQDWGLIDVREGAHMFYWLHYTTANVTNYIEKPLIIWFDGGPGVGSTGFGNFEEIGPLDLELKPRNSTWVKYANVLFVDNPVGSGFSYVDNEKYLATDNQMIADDLVKFMKEFYTRHPEFKSVPLHVFGESYGGKMETDFALKLNSAIKNGEIESNFKSISLGDSWISSLLSIHAIPPLLLYTSIVDSDGFNGLMQQASSIANAYNAKNYTLSSMLALDLWDEIAEYVDLYNILTPIAKENRTGHLDTNRDKMLHDLMRGPVSKALNISSNIVWGSQREMTFNALLEDFMKPVVHVVEELLNTTDLEIIVYSGQLDLICATPATEAWVNALNWKMKREYTKAPRKFLTINGIIEGYVKNAGKLTMYWINRAGHTAPAENPVGMDYIMKQTIKYNSSG